MKLISMVDYILQEKKVWSGNENEYYEIGKSVVNYATFLKRPLKLEMFVPCDEDGNVLEQPCEIMEIKGCRDCACREYLKAKEKVLFEGFYIHYTVLLYPNQVAFCDISEWETPDWMNIEWLLNNSFQDLQLTPTAIKQIQP